jgi:hypothetical protein
MPEDPQRKEDTQGFETYESVGAEFLSYYTAGVHVQRV